MDTNKLRRHNKKKFSGVAALGSSRHVAIHKFDNFFL